MIQRTLTFLCPILIICLFAQTPLAGEAQPLKIGVMLCLSGTCAEWGQNSLNGIQLATKQVNQQGGVLGRTIELKVEDTREGNNAASAVSAYRSLTNDKQINLVIGPTWSIGGLAISPLVAKQKDLIVTSPSLGVSEFNESAPNIFNIWPHDSYSTKRLAEYAFEKGWKRVAILGCDDPWVEAQTKAFEQVFSELGGEIAVKIAGDPKNVSIKAEATKIVHQNPDAIMYTDLYRLATMAKELKRLNFDKPQLSILMDDTRLQEAQGALDGTIVAKYEEPTSKFVSSYKLEYNIEPGIGADTGYDTLMMYVKAIREAGGFDTEQIQKRMLTLSFDGASGNVKLDSFGGVIKEPLLWRVSGTTFTKLS